MRRGEIVLAVLPFTDLSGQKHRPALIVSSDSRIGDDVLVAFVTSYHGQVVFSTEVLLLDSDADFSQTRLKRSSVIKAVLFWEKLEHCLSISCSKSISVCA
ncbi:hypothetical protein DCC62_04225 [candidate division KSB1 bacterium]|nr:MAG: hypothetical protein DCC62_04225 [candidate division KSB1 bacterium]